MKNPVSLIATDYYRHKMSWLIANSASTVKTSPDNGGVYDIFA